MSEFDRVDEAAIAFAAGRTAPLEAANAKLTAKVADLEERLAPPLKVGATVNVPAPSLTAFVAAALTLGRLTVRRSFPKPDTIVRTVAADKAAGLTSFVSLKPPVSLPTVSAIAKDLPAGTYLTLNHEPENDMRGAEFVGLFRDFYSTVKAANPALLVGPVHLCYGWRNPAGVGSAGVNTGPLEPPAVWDVGDEYRDFTGADIYSAKGTPLETYPQFQAWLKFFTAASSKPLAIVEYGQAVTPPGAARDPARELLRAKLIAADLVYIASLPRIGMWLLWNGTGAQGDWSLRDVGSQSAWSSVSA